jgi:CheY-like chemotaxis protein
MPQRLDGVRVLVVEDDRDCRELFRAMLEMEGATVTTAPDARHGLRMLEPLRPHVIVSDLALPGEDGCWLVANARSAVRPGAPRPATVIVTAHTDDLARRRCLRAGCDVFLTKPVDDGELCAVVGRLASRATIVPAC